MKKLITVLMCTILLSIGTITFAGECPKPVENHAKISDHLKKSKILPSPLWTEPKGINSAGGKIRNPGNSFSLYH
jgi:hypothetical protein